VGTQAQGADMKDEDNGPGGAGVVFVLLVILATFLCMRTLDGIWSRLCAIEAKVGINSISCKAK
jgi:cobalamin synthase